ncbi:MAG: hypothetical protein ACO3F2_05525 [Roseiflexaceae bacterium]
MSRLLTPIDLIGLRRKARSLVVLDGDVSLLRRHRVLLLAVRSILENHTTHSTTVVRHGDISAMLQALTRHSRPERELIALASYGLDQRYPSDHDMWFNLLESHVVQSARDRIQRLYATLDNHHADVAEIFRQSGYVPFSRQLLLRLDGPDWDQGTRLATMAPQTRHDVWGIHQLYGQITPRPVQLAEAKAARDWMLPLSTPWERVKQKAWVQRHNEQIMASLRIQSGREAHVMRLLVQPSARDEVPDMLRFGMSQIADTLPIWLVLRDYQEDLLWSAQDLGFQPFSEQSLLVRHNVALIRRPAFARVLKPNHEQGSPIPTIVPAANKQARFYAPQKRHH